jgi:hypothetical protein
MKFRVLGLHNGDHTPVRNDHLRFRDDDADLMELSQVSPVDTVPFRNGEDAVWWGVLPKPSERLGAEDLKEADSDTWADDYTIEMAQKISLLSRFMYMFYVVDPGGKESDYKAGNHLCRKVNISPRLDWDTDSKGRRYGFIKSKEEHSSRSPSHESPSSALDLYGGDKERAHTHWCNTQ